MPVPLPVPEPEPVPLPVPVPVPLPVPAAYGSWELTGGVTFLFFGDGLKNINGSDDDIRTIGVFGVGVSY